MRVGVTTPVLSLLPRAHAKWEEDAGLPEVVEIARALDRLGYHHLTCSEHVAIPKPTAAVRGGVPSCPGRRMVRAVAEQRDCGGVCEESA